MPVNDILQVRTISHRADIAQLGMMVRHFRITSVAAPEPTQADITTSLDVLISPLIRQLMSTTARYRGVGVQRVFPTPPTIETFGAAAAGDGTVVGDALPPQVCGLESFRTALAGRRFRGRMYIPFPSEDDSGANGAPTATYISRATLLGNTLGSTISIMGSGGQLSITPVVYHRVTRTADNIVLVIHGTVWATQRRRGRFGRQNVPPV